MALRLCTLVDLNAVNGTIYLVCVCVCVCFSVILVHLTVQLGGEFERQRYRQSHYLDILKTLETV